MHRKQKNLHFKMTGMDFNMLFNNFIFLANRKKVSSCIGGGRGAAI